MRVAILPVGFLETNCYILSDEKKSAAVIDPGADGARIIEALEAMGAEDIKILLTHGHFDHIGAVKEIKDRFGAPVYIHKGDAALLTDARIGGHKMPIPEQEPADVLLEGGEEIALGELSVQVIPTPGHTPGGVCFLCGEYLFTGDTLFCEDIGRTDLAGGSFETLCESLKAIARIEGDKIVYPGHAEASTLNHEKVHNLYLRGAL